MHAFAHQITKLETRLIARFPSLISGQNAYMETPGYGSGVRLEGQELLLLSV